MGQTAPACADDEVDPQIILGIVEKHRRARGALIAVLEEVQAEYGYLPEEALRAVADGMGRSLVDIYGVATFYRSFSLVPRGEHLISACLGTACHVRGAPAVVEELERQLGIRVGETTPDREFSLETVNCLGACALGPVVVIDGHYFSKMKKLRVRQIIADTVAGLDRIEIGKDPRVFPIDVSCPRCGHSLMDDATTMDGHASILVSVSFGEKRGGLRLSSLYGSYSVSSEHDIPENTVTDFFCPHCRAQLVGSWQCPMCGAPMVPLAVAGGGVVQICSRRGCRSHMLDVA